MGVVLYQEGTAARDFRSLNQPTQQVVRAILQLEKPQDQHLAHFAHNLGASEAIRSAAETLYKVNDVLKIRIPSQEIIECITFKDQLSIIITGGRSQGETGIVIGFGDESGWKKTATVRTPNGEDIRTLMKYVFPIGVTESLISLPENT